MTGPPPGGEWIGGNGPGPPLTNSFTTTPISYDSSPVWWWLLWTGLLGKGLPDLEARGGGRRAKGGL